MDGKALIRKQTFEQLKREVRLQESRQVDLPKSASRDTYSPMQAHFPNGFFPLSVVHQFRGADPESLAATGGFVCSLLRSLQLHKGPVIWVSRGHACYPSGFRRFGMDARHFLFIRPDSEKQQAWVTEEALRCSGVSVVISELGNCSFKQARRFQLASEQSGATGFLLHTISGVDSVTPCNSLWTIRHYPSLSPENLPGVGEPCWQVQLHKMRHGKPGEWILRWDGQQLLSISKSPERSQSQLQTRQTG